MFVMFAIITYKYLTSDDLQNQKALSAQTTSAPTTSAPTTSAPTTSAPTTSAPTTQAPTTRAPTTSAPTTSAPTTSAPTTSAPTTPVPTTLAPMNTQTSEPVGYFYHTKYNTVPPWRSTKYGIVKGVIDKLKTGAWWSKQWKILPPWAVVEDIENKDYKEDDPNIITRIYEYNGQYFFSNPERNDPDRGCTWLTNTYMNGSGVNGSGVGDQFMLKRVYQDQNRNWLTYDGNIIVTSDGTITI